MSIDCWCDSDPPYWWRRTSPKARRGYTCEECRGFILLGERHEHVVGMWERGEVSDFRTCERCVDLRTWVANNVPCFCWAHGNLEEDMRETVEEAVARAPDETVGLRFGLLRRKTVRDKINQQRRAA